MNPVFVFLVIIGAIALWAMLSTAFFPIDTIISWFSGDDADDEIKEKENEKNEK